MTTEQLFEAFKIFESKRGKRIGNSRIFGKQLGYESIFTRCFQRFLFEVAVKLQKETGATLTLSTCSGGIE